MTTTCYKFSKESQGHSAVALGSGPTFTAVPRPARCHRHASRGRPPGSLRAACEKAKAQSLQLDDKTPRRNQTQDGERGYRELSAIRLIDEWHLDLEKVVTMEKLGSYPACPDSRKTRELRAIRPI